MESGSYKKAEQAVPVCPKTCYHIEFISMGICIFKKSTGYYLSPIVFVRIEIFLVLVILETDTCSEFMIGVIDDGLVDQVAINILLPGIIGGQSEIIVLAVIKGR